MAALLIPVAAYLLLYAPGHYLLRGTAAGGSAGTLFREVLLSACCASWVGLVLAELSLFSLPALLGCLAVVTVTAALWTRRRGSSRYGMTDLIGLGVAALVWLALSPPLDTRILGSDSAGYLAAGVHLSRHGSLIIHDPTLPLLPPQLKFYLFPSVGTTPFAPPYLRLLGSLILRSADTDEVLPAFHHLITVWVAVFHALGGSAAAQWAITLFGGLSVWAMVEFAATTSGRVAALTFLALLSLSAVQSWYSRFLMPEIPGQFFLWGGLTCMAFWRGTQRRADAVLAGLAFGIAGLMRIENAALLLVALAVGLSFAEGRLRTQRWWLVGGAVAIWAHATAHLIYFRTHYVVILLSLLPEAAAVFSGASWLRVAVLIVGAAALLMWQFQRGLSALRSMVPITALAACVVLWAEWQHGWSGLGLLVAYNGVPTLAFGALGLALWTRQVDRADVAGRVLATLVALALVQVLLAPHVTPVPIWMVRRSATILLPGFCLGVALLCQMVAQRWHWSVAVLIGAIALAGQARPFAQLRWTPYYQGGLGHIRAVGAMLPRGACLFYDTPLTAWGLGPGLWAELDMPAYYLSRYDAPFIALMLRAFDGLPVYWMADGRTPPPRISGITATRIGSYAFSVLTPTLDSKTKPGASNQWDYTVVIYALQPEGGAEAK